MLLISKKEFCLPLSEKVRIQGLRVETGPSPQALIADSKLKLQDNWKLQLAFCSYANNTDQAAPGFLEFPVLWEEEFDLSEDFPVWTAAYTKKPACVASRIEESRIQPPLLHLTIEATLSADPKPVAIADPKPVAIKECPKISDQPSPDLTRINAWEENIRELQKKISFLEDKLSEIENSSINNNSSYGRLAGTVLDSFRLVPVSKAIIEIYRKDREEPLIKTATDMRGVYVFSRLQPGLYDIKIKHPRYAVLEIKDYPIFDLDDKNQDFLMRR